jgi:hypothetical protein
VQLLRTHSVNIFTVCFNAAIAALAVHQFGSDAG